MGNLSELTFRTSYHKGRDDIARDFYLPCMSRALEYDRAVGFFRSAAFIIAWPALKEFIGNGGRIRILCSQVLAAEDVDALDHGYSARADQEISKRLTEEVRAFVDDDVLRAPARVLAALVAQRSLELQIAILKPSDLASAHGRIFHDKLGIFRDGRGNNVVFKGSMNETWSGLSADGNLESVDVAASWMGSRDLERTTTEENYFRDLWANNYPTLKVRPFPAVARDELVRAADPQWEATLQSLLAQEREPKVNDARGRTLLPHQAAGLASWAANGRQGILDFATGSGKTFTAISAIKECIGKHQQPVLVVVPDQVLFAQWYKELDETTRDLSATILRAGAGHDLWKSSLPLWTRPDSAPRIILSTVQTASQTEFRELIVGGSHLALVADEVHRLGSPHNRQLLDESKFGPRLGLSATPERAGDPEGTKVLLEYFRGILEPRYRLEDAVRDGVLCRYFYRPHTARLDADEADEWHSLSREIAQLRARTMRKSGGEDFTHRIQHLLIRRARIVKHARAKVPLAVAIFRESYHREQRWIVYCEDLAQLNEVSGALRRAGIKNFPFHSQMEGDRGETLRWLDTRGGVVVAIKCLDEGVDIPSVTHALILASSKNPREFIQRRGRVLRKAANKPLAYVHDAIVLPPEGGDDTSRDKADPITAGELARAVEFARHAENPAAAADLQSIAVSCGVDWKSLLAQGEEDEDV